MRISRWPVWITAILLVLAVLACGFSISTARFKEVKLYTDPSGTTSTINYGPTDTFYCIVKLANAPHDTRVKAVWTEVARPDNTAVNQQVGSDEEMTGSGTLVFQADPPEGGWPFGIYRVDLYLNGKVRETRLFKVK